MKKITLIVLMAMFLSVSASVVADVLLGHWKMDDDLLDSSGNGYDATFYDCNSVFSGDAMDGSSLELEDNGCAVSIDSTPFENLYQDGMTVSAWFKTGGTGTWMLPVTKRNANTGGWTLQTHNTNGQVGFYMIGAGGACWSGAGNVVVDNEWHFVAATYDPVTANEIKIFVDGLEANSVAITGTAATNVGVPVVIGKDLRANGGGFPYAGLIDDVRIYDYPLSQYEVIDVYNDVVEPDEVFCLEEPAVDVTGPAGEPDCRLDLYDFALIASEWLDSGIYPPVQ